MCQASNSYNWKKVYLHFQIKVEVQLNFNEKAAFWVLKLKIH